MWLNTFGPAQSYRVCWVFPDNFEYFQSQKPSYSKHWRPQIELSTTWRAAQLTYLNHCQVLEVKLDVLGGKSMHPSTHIQSTGRQSLTGAARAVLKLLIKEPMCASSESLAVTWSYCYVSKQLHRSHFGFVVPSSTGDERCALQYLSSFLRPPRRDLPSAWSCASAAGIFVSLADCRLFHMALWP